MNFESAANSQEKNEVYEEEFSYDNNLDNIETARELTSRELLTLGWPEEQVNAFSLAVHEAMANAIIHGNLEVQRNDGEDESVFLSNIATAQSKNMAKHVQVFFRFTKDDARAQIKDQGIFLPETLIDTTTGEGVVKSSGRGLRLIENGVDTIQFSEGEIIFHKKRKDNEDGI